jgi:hypothetical protein
MGNWSTGCFLKNSHEISIVPSPKLSQPTLFGFMILNPEVIKSNVAEKIIPSNNDIKFDGFHRLLYFKTFNILK